MSEELYRFITRDFVKDRHVLKLGNRYYIQLPMDKNWLWEKLHKEKVLVDVLITWDWNRKGKAKKK